MASMKTIGIRELRQHASRIIEAAEGGTTYRVTNHGKDTGVLIGKQQHAQHDAAEERTGASPDQIIASGVYDSPKPETYEEEMLRLVERGRDRSGRIDSP
jgi:prevent-host-death family protein